MHAGWNGPSLLVAFVVTLAVTMGGQPVLEANSQEPAHCAETWELIYRGQTVELVVDPLLLALRLAAGGGDAQASLAELLARAGIPETSFLLLPQGYRDLSLVELDGQVRADERAQLLALLEAAAPVRSAAPVLRYGDTLLVPTGEYLLTFDASLGDREIERRIVSWGATVRGRYPGLRPVVLISYGDASRDGAEIARWLGERPGVATAEPNFIVHLRPQAVPSDPLFASQWHHQNTGQTGGTPGADVTSTDAWDTTVGGTGLTLAIIDEGVDVDHEDLASAILPGHDSTDQPSPGGVPGNCLPADSHGTSCAGIAAAAGDNGLGVAGVGWQVGILPVRVGYADHWSETAWEVDAITWATDNGADVISCSWGGGPPSPAVQGAVQYATAVGRGGLGTPLFFSAGNDGGALLYPARYPETIAVGASNYCDERKSVFSCDSEPGWASNHGPGLDLVAPGVQIATTDNTGAAGESPGNYNLAFSGTSAACPLAAGAALLLLDLGPGLTAEEVRTYLVSAALDQVGVPAEDTPGWDEFMGWGRVDLAQLVGLIGAPAPPAAFTCTATGPDVQLDWQNGEPYDSVELYRDGSLLASLPGGSVSWLDSAPPLGPHRYRLQGIAGGVHSPLATCLALMAEGTTDLVWAPPGAAGSVDGGGAIADALVALGRVPVTVDDLDLVTDLDAFQVIWVNLGIAPYKHVLGSGDAARLETYLTDGAGGSGLYLEGGDTWAFDPQTPLHALFGIAGLSDGFGDLSLVNGQAAPGCDLTGIDLAYAGENLFIDRLSPALGAGAVQVNVAPVFDCAVMRQGPGFSTVGTSYELGGLFTPFGGSSTREQLVAAFIDSLSAPTTVDFVRGDANSSGTLNLVDVIVILNDIFLGLSMSCPDAGDANDSGVVDISDAVYLVGYLFASGPAPPPPFATAGPDETADGLVCPLVTP